MTILHRVCLSSLFVMMTIYFWLNDPVLAVSQPKTSDIFNAGLNHIHQQNYQQSLVDFTRVINRQDDLVVLGYSNRCLVNLQLHNYGAAKLDCISAIQNNSDNIEVHLNLGLAYYHQGEFSKAISQYQKIIQRENRDYRAYYNRGLAYLALNNYDLAIADFKIALPLTKSEEALHRSAFLGRGNLARVASPLKGGEGVTPHYNIKSKSLIYNDLALAYMMLDKDEPAVFNFSKAIALDVNNYNAYFNRGCAYHRQGKYQAAIEDFTQVIQLKPDFTQVYVNRAILRHQIGEMDAAFSDLNIALQQYQNQGNSKQYNLVAHLKQQFFYAQPSRSYSIV